MLYWILQSMALLAVLSLSYLARSKTSSAKVSFTGWCVSLQFFYRALDEKFAIYGNRTYLATEPMRSFWIRPLAVV